MLLRVSNAGLQDDLRNTMRAYTEEKHQLRAHLSTLRLDLSQLHRDDRTVSSSDQSCAASHVSFPTSDAEPELRRLMEDEEDDDKTARSTRTHATVTTAGTTTATALAPSLQLPALKGLNPYKHGAGSNVSKNLRFSSQPTTARSDDKDAVDGGTKRSFLGEDGWDSGREQEAKERQKFKELQKNQDMLRNIGRANLREKRMSLIRLPTITSAKKRRQTTWDSGKNVSRPAGKSTAFETHPYLEDSVKIKKKNFRIPAIRDPKRSEIQLDPDVPRQPDHQKKKKVQFTRPGEGNTSMLTVAATNPNLTAASGGVLNASSMTSATVSVSGTEDAHNDSMMGGESLNTTLADTTMGDTSFQDITFDPEQIKALAQRGSIDKSTSGGNSGATTQRDDDHLVDEMPAKADTAKQLSQELANTKPTDLPPLKIKTLMRKNVLLHDLNMPGLTGGVHSKGNWDKASDMSVLTKISRLSLETEEWKNSYMSVPDPDKRKKTLSDIMFAVR
ncbi:hypothetical protein ElyMa_001389500 [Elysia marginata]|uniref:Uncharacterized protein n=1 Tax=Elysia marginata TaxID=1093978 RepID=A0AAV4IRF9_9GAST|nr:hypothetical protein ElyMa_001389500 [Elysia marginata]